jgi:hypothetical protein
MRAGGITQGTSAPLTLRRSAAVCSTLAAARLIFVFKLQDTDSAQLTARGWNLVEHFTRVFRASVYSEARIPGRAKIADPVRQELTSCDLEAPIVLACSS